MALNIACPVNSKNKIPKEDTRSLGIFSWKFIIKGKFDCLGFVHCGSMLVDRSGKQCSSQRD